MTPKEFYKTYLADDKVGLIGEYLLTAIILNNPVHVLEFGCGTGKHLIRLNDRSICTLGIDISAINVITAITKYKLPFVVCSDESYLRNICNVDVVFTCSVLDHIENIDEIIAEFKRIANKTVYLAETNDHETGQHYFKHDYESMGFVKVPDFDWKGEDGAMYYVWKWERGFELKPITDEKEIEKYSVDYTKLNLMNSLMEFHKEEMSKRIENFVWSDEQHNAWMERARACAE